MAGSWRSFAHSFRDFGEQPFGLLLDGQDIGADLFQRPQRLGLVEVAREADLVADPGDLLLDPGVGLALLLPFAASRLRVRKTTGPITGPRKRAANR